MSNAERRRHIRNAITNGKAARTEDQLQEAVADLLDNLLPPYTWTHPSPNVYRSLAGAFLGKRINGNGLVYGSRISRLFSIWKSGISSMSGLIASRSRLDWEGER